MTTLTKRDIERLRELLGKATPGPWTWVSAGIQHVAGPDRIAICDSGQRNGGLIAEVRNLLPALLDTIERQDEALARIERGCTLPDDEVQRAIRDAARAARLPDWEDEVRRG